MRDFASHLYGMKLGLLQFTVFLGCWSRKDIGLRLEVGADRHSRLRIEVGKGTRKASCHRTNGPDESADRELTRAAVTSLTAPK